MEETKSEPCSIISCTQSGVSTVEAELASWIITAHFCREHARQLDHGTPLAGAGLDPSRLTVSPIGDVVPSTVTTRALSPQ